MAVVAEQKAFSGYPQVMDDIFVKKPITINILPSEFIQSLEKRIKAPTFTSAKSFIEFVESEIKFWTDNDKAGKLKEFSKIDSLRSAKSHFDNAKREFLNSTTNTTNARNSLSSSINNLSQGVLYSKTTLAKYLLKIIDEKPEFLRGFKVGLLNNKTTNLTNTVSDYEGLALALQFRKFVNGFETPGQAQIDSLSESIALASDQYAKLNAAYTESFHQQEERLKQIAALSEQKIQELNQNSDDYFKQRDDRCKELESLYEEKLRLQAPAEYWDTMEKDYTKKGRWWMGVSVVVTILVVGALILTLAFLPNLFSEDSHWFDVFKNSAIITVVTSILVYMLRTCIKMAMSSFHLSRDAKERNKLTYFYLALIEKKAVTDKERAIVLNALFSRADTGLLKGDSSPSMSSNVTDLVNSLNGKS